MSKKYEQVIFKEAADPDESYAYDESDDVFFAEELREAPEGLAGAIIALEDGAESDMSDKTLKEVLEPMTEGEGSFGELAEDLEAMDEDVSKFIDEHGDMTLGDLLPGSDVRADDLEDDVEEKETDYANDGDLTKFMDYIQGQYPGNIPQHDGTTTVGCERALSFLDRSNGDISRAIRDDHDNVLDIRALEDIRVNIIRDTMVLKEHLNKLKRKVKDEHSKAAAAKAPPAWTSPSGEVVETGDLVKEAYTPNNIVIAITAFERAIAGIMINAHVSAGHPFEDVYKFLKEKYDLTDREELSIFQVCTDSGFHIFKDRGIFGDDADGDKGANAVDFMKNYFA
jgi:hypothetical protein